MVTAADDWDALGKSPRRRIRAAVVEAFVDRVLRAPLEDAGGLAPPRVQVYAATRDGERVTARFVLDYLDPSASLDRDDATHFILAGSAVYVRHQGVTVAFEEDRSVELREGEVGYYDPERAAQHVCAQKRAELEGAAPPPESATVAAPAGARASAAPTVVTIVRCPRCGSTDAGATEHLYEITQMTCASCGHREHVDTHQIDEDWNVGITLAPGATELPAFVAPLAPREEPATPPVAREASPASTPDTWGPMPELFHEPADALSPDLRCPRCGSRHVRDDPGRAERHFTFLACRDCDHGQEISSLAAAARWKGTA